MKAAENVLDRIEQSFELFKGGFKILFFPFLIYYLISFVFFILVFIFIIYSGLIQSIFQTMNYSSILAIFSNPKIVLLAVIFIFVLIVYLIIYMPFIIYSIRIIGKIYNKKPIGDFNENFKFALSRFFEMMKTYWYIFAYVALIPSFFFILGGGIFNIAYFMDLDSSFRLIGGILMILGLILFVIFSIYRGLKTNFSLYSAIEKDEYTKENFNISVKITNNNWWRILGNLLLVGLIISMLSGVASNIISIFFSSGSGYASLFSDFGKMDTGSLASDPSKIKEIVSSFMNKFSFFNYFVSNFFQILISTIGKIFTIIFIYVFYRRLLDESGLDIEKKVEEKTIFTIEENNKTVEL